MSDQLAILISDRIFKYKDESGKEKQLTISKPKWNQVKEFAGILETVIGKFYQTKNEAEFAEALLKDSASDLFQGIEDILKICLRKEKAADGGINKLLGDIDYDVVLSILFNAIDMNASFFAQNMKQINVKMIQENLQPGET